MSLPSVAEELVDVEFQGLVKVFIIFVVDFVMIGTSLRLNMGREPVFCTQSILGTGTTLALVFEQPKELIVGVEYVTVEVEETADAVQIVVRIVSVDFSTTGFTFSASSESLGIFAGQGLLLDIDSATSSFAELTERFSVIEGSLDFSLLSSVVSVICAGFSASVICAGFSANNSTLEFVISVLSIGRIPLTSLSQAEVVMGVPIEETVMSSLFILHVTVTDDVEELGTVDMRHEVVAVFSRLSVGRLLGARSAIVVTGGTGTDVGNGSLVGLAVTFSALTIKVLTLGVFSRAAVLSQGGNEETT